MLGLGPRLGLLLSLGGLLRRLLFDLCVMRLLLAPARNRANGGSNGCRFLSITCNRADCGALRGSALDDISLLCSLLLCGKLSKMTGEK